MDIYFERISTKSDIDLLKYWLEDKELLKLARMNDYPMSDMDFSAYLNTRSFIVYVDGVAIGYARLFDTENPEEGEIGIVIALPEYRNRGVGTEIGIKLLAVAATMGFKYVNWATAEYNLPSIKLAEKLGFKFHSLIPMVISVGGERYNALVYRYYLREEYNAVG